MRLVIDTNVFISALLHQPSLPSRLVALRRARRFELLTSDDQLDEIRRVTRYPKIRERLHARTAGRLVNDLRASTVIAGTLPVVDVSNDPSDNDLLAMAIAGPADFLIAGDKRDLLAIGAFPEPRSRRSGNF